MPKRLRPSSGTSPTVVATGGRASFHVAGLLVRAHRDELPGVVSALSSLSGVEIHHQESERGRLVVTLESPDLDGQEIGFSGIQRVPGVIGVDLVYHCVSPLDAEEERGCASLGRGGSS